MLHADITEKIIAAAMRIHTSLGPGLLESVYREYLFFELRRWLGGGEGETDAHLLQRY